MLLVIAIIIGIPVFLRFIHSKNAEDDLKVGVPGPKGWPLLGSLLEVRPYIKDLKLYKILHQYHETFGDVIQLRLGPVKMILSRDPKLTEAIVTNPKFGKSSEYKLFKDWSGENLVTMNGEKWQKMRKLMTPAFHFQILERFIPIFEEKTDIMIEIIEKHGAQSIELYPLLDNLTLDIISETSMGVSLNAQIDSHSPFIEANHKLLNIFQERLFSGYLTIDWIFRLSPLYKEHRDSIKIVNEVVDKVIEQRREKLLTEKNNNFDVNSDSSTKQRPALLDILLQAQIDENPLTNENIRHEVITFMFAGHESTAGTLFFTSYLIAKHPEVQQKLVKEIQMNSLDKDSHPLKIRDLNALPYMDNVIKEALRLYPPAIMNFKSCTEDSNILKSLMSKKKK
uniref:CSON008717 protein n=1 Tax=Culicoides sonorensis TaxID=179676 RepID=A0A336KET5_CULSO